MCEAVLVKQQLPTEWTAAGVTPCSALRRKRQGDRMRFEVFLGNTLQVKRLDAKEDGLGVMVWVVEW